MGATERPLLDYVSGAHPNVLASAKGRGAPRSPFAALGAHAIAALRRADPRNGAAEA